MNFELDEAQSVIAASAAEVLREADPAAAWQALAKAGLLALTLPGWMDGDDLGAGAAAVLLTEVGRQAAQVPALATIMLGSLPVVRWGSRELQERILAGVGAVRSRNALDFMRDKVPGVHVPDDVYRRLRAVPADQTAAEGARLAAETVQQLSAIDGVAGVHLLVAGNEQAVPGILDSAGVRAVRDGR